MRQMRGDLVPDSQPLPVQHFYVRPGSDVVAGSECDSSGLEASEPDPPTVSPAIVVLLALPEITPPPSNRRAPQDALIDYSQLLFLTSEEYVLAMEEKGRRREEARVQSQLRRD